MDGSVEALKPPAPRRTTHDRTSAFGTATSGRCPNSGRTCAQNHIRRARLDARKSTLESSQTCPQSRRRILTLENLDDTTPWSWRFALKLPNSTTTTTRPCNRRAISWRECDVAWRKEPLPKAVANRPRSGSGIALSPGVATEPGASRADANLIRKEEFYG